MKLSVAVQLSPELAALIHVFPALPVPTNMESLLGRYLFRALSVLLETRLTAQYCSIFRENIRKQLAAELSHCTMYSTPCTAVCRPPNRAAVMYTYRWMDEDDWLWL
ncbi:hypothetical protein GGR56DRAFT_620081 [Xylariaceae sp. FL0804]|nr:hypothetical protein GGR56DRAFT_620081 [Xylariaceae sp. FL0804]